MNWHILPTNDSGEHKKSSTCKCNPKATVTENGDLLITHNSFDKRELVENLLKQINNSQS